MGVALGDDIRDQLGGQFTPGIGFAVRMAQPGTGMDFVDIGGGVLPVPIAALRKPLVILSSVLGCCDNISGRSWAMLEAASIGGGFDQLGAAVPVDVLEAVEAARPCLGDGAGPDARVVPWSCRAFRVIYCLRRFLFDKIRQRAEQGEKTA